MAVLRGGNLRRPLGSFHLVNDAKNAKRKDNQLHSRGNCVGVLSLIWKGDKRGLAGLNEIISTFAREEDYNVSSIKNVHVLKRTKALCGTKALEMVR